jgi:uncharacterized protein (DUF1778 family)
MCRRLRSRSVSFREEAFGSGVAGLEIACREADRVLLDQAYIAVSEETFANFCQILDSPPEPSEGLLKLMRVKAPWA